MKKLNLHLFDDEEETTAYLVTEECMICINDVKTVLHKNSMVQLTPNGVPKGVTAYGDGTVIADSDALTSLIAQGIVVAIETE